MKRGWPGFVAVKEEWDDIADFLWPAIVAVLLWVASIVAVVIIVKLTWEALS